MKKMSKPVQTIAYKSILLGPSGSYVYIFGVTVNGVYACYRRVTHTHGTNTPICNHKLYANASGHRYIVFTDSVDGEFKLYLWQIKKDRWRIQGYGYASEETGISTKTLRGVGRKIKQIKEEFPSFSAMYLPVPPSKKKEPVIKNGKRHAKEWSPYDARRKNAANK